MKNKTFTSMIGQTVANIQEPPKNQEFPLTGETAIKTFYTQVIFKAYESCDPGEEPKHLWIRHEDEQGNYTYYRFPVTEKPQGYRTQLKEKNNPLSRETTGSILDLFELLRSLSEKPGNGVTFIPACPPHLPLTERFNGTRIINFEIDGMPLNEQQDQIHEIKGIGLIPNSVGHSGNKSLHICFVTKDNLTADQTRYLKRLFLPLGADQQVANSLLGGMRFPGVTRQSTGQEQTLEFFNDATYTFNDLVKLIKDFYIYKGLEFESFEKVQARQELESDRLKQADFSPGDYEPSDIEKMLTEFDRNFFYYRKGEGSYPHRLAIAKAVMKLKISMDKPEELCPNLFQGVSLGWQSLEKATCNNPLGAILAEGRKLLNDSELQFPDWFKEKYKPKNENPKNPTKRSKGFQKIFSPSALKKDLEALYHKGLTGDELNSDILAIAADHDQPSKEINYQYKLICERLEREDSREDIRKEIAHVIRCQKAQLQLEKILPKELASGINRLAHLMHLRPEVYATALLVGLSSVCNPKSKVILNKTTDFIVNCGLNGGIVANSSQKKSPVNKAMIGRPLFNLQEKFNQEFEELFKKYEKELERYESLKKGKKNHDQLEEAFPDGPPVKPIKKTVILTNFTIEALKDRLANQKDHGILSLNDELAGLFKSANQYRGGKGADMEDLLSLYDGAGFSVARKSGDTFIKDALLSIYGSIQPEVLKKLMGDGKDSSGQWSRFIWVEQPLVAGKMPRDGEDIDLNPMIEHLYESFLDYAQSTSNHIYTLSRDAFLLFADTYDQFEIERVKCGDHPMGTVWGKSEGRIGKLALILHLIKHIFGGNGVPTVIEVDTVEAAIALTHFYIGQVQSLYGQLLGGNENLTPQLLKIQRLAESKGEITARQVKQFTKLSNHSEQITQWFRDLEAMGMGKVISTNRTIKYLPSVEAVESVEAVKIPSTPVEPLQNKNFKLSVETVEEKSTFSENLNPITPIPSSLAATTFPNLEIDISYKESSTLSTLTDETQSQQGIEYADNFLHLPTPKNPENPETHSQQAIKPSVEVSTLSSTSCSSVEVSTLSSTPCFKKGDQVIYQNDTEKVWVISKIEEEQAYIWEKGGNPNNLAITLLEHLRRA